MKNRRALLTLALAFVLALMPLAIYADQNISVKIDGQAVDFEGKGPQNLDGRILVPVRDVFEAMGYDVNWNKETRQATLVGAGYVVVLTIDSNTFTTNGESHQLDIPTQIVDGRTLVPLRVVVESVGYNLEWDRASSTVLISSGAAQPQTEAAPPQIEEEQPQVEEEQPQVEEEQPQVEEEQPQVEEEQPQVEEEQPQTEEEQPQTEEEQPQTEEEQPQTEEEQPQTEEEQPQTEEEQPQTEEEQPQTEEE